MKNLLIASFLIVGSIVCGQNIITGNPQIDYYKMVNLQSDNDIAQGLYKYAEIRITSKRLELSGMILGVMTGLLVSTDVLSPSEPPAKLLYIGSGVLFLTGWIMDWAAIQNIRQNQTSYVDVLDETERKFENSEYDQPKYKKMGVGKNVSYYKKTHSSGTWLRITEEEYLNAKSRSSKKEK